MGLSRCLVSYRDTVGVEHSVEVEAESLYEAVALAVAEFRDSELDDVEPKLMSEFIVTVYRKPTEHRLRLRDVEQWAQPSVLGGPAGITRREKVWKLLGHS